MFPDHRIYFVTLAVTLTTAQLITFKDGNVGVNFAGFHASAGLGGLLNGDLSKGGLHAEAGTPFGQSARAGLGGILGQDGSARGGLYAGATAGSGVSAAAGLEGAADSSGSVGQIAAGASAGGAVKSVEKTSIHVNSAPANTLEKNLNSEPVDAVITKTIHRPRLTKFAQAHFDAVSNANVVPDKPDTINVVEKTYIKPVAPIIVHKQITSGPAPPGGLLSRLFASLASPTSASGEVSAEIPVKKTEYGATATGSFSSRAGLFDDIFNIPISTLQAVNRLVNGIAGGGSVSVTKTAHTF